MKSFITTVLFFNHKLMAD